MLSNRRDGHEFFFETCDANLSSKSWGYYPQHHRSDYYHALGIHHLYWSLCIRLRRGRRGNQKLRVEVLVPLEELHPVDNIPVDGRYVAWIPYFRDHDGHDSDYGVVNHSWVVSGRQDG